MRSNRPVKSPLVSAKSDLSCNFNLHLSDANNDPPIERCLRILLHIFSISKNATTYPIQKCSFEGFWTEDLPVISGNEQNLLPQAGQTNSQIHRFGGAPYLSRHYRNEQNSSGFEKAQNCHQHQKGIPAEDRCRDAGTKNAEVGQQQTTLNPELLARLLWNPEMGPFWIPWPKSLK